MSDADFQTVRTNATAGRVFYVWGSGEVLLPIIGSSFVLKLRAPMLGPRPTTTINPNNFGTSTGAQPDNDYRMHFWNETSGATITGADYSIMSFNNTPSSKTLSIVQLLLS